MLPEMIDDNTWAIYERCCMKLFITCVSENTDRSL